MAKKGQLSEDLCRAIRNVGNGPFVSWLRENNFKINTQHNLFEELQTGLDEEKWTVDDIKKGVSELEESGNKKIHFFKPKSSKYFAGNLPDVLKNLKRISGISPEPEIYKRVSPNQGPTFNYCTLENNILKIKYSEKHFDFPFDVEAEQTVKTEKVVYIYLIVDLSDGFSQVRTDSAGEKHTHKNDQKKSSESLYEAYYRDKLLELFPDAGFSSVDLSRVANHIALNERIKFRLNAELTTLPDHTKMKVSAKSPKFDVRDNKQHVAAVASEGTTLWLTEDVIGYWVAAASDGELKSDLFMRIYRKNSEIKVQRGCLEKELNYGIRQIREIQKTV